MKIQKNIKSSEFIFPYYLGNVKFSTTTAIPPFCIAVSIATAII